MVAQLTWQHGIRMNIPDWRIDDWEYIVDYAYDAHGNAQKYGITDLQTETLDDRLKEQLEHIPM